MQKSCKRAAREAGLTKHVTPHVRRHSYATGLMESGVDLLTISRLLGHRSFSTTLVYLHVRRPHLERTVSPLDLLPVDQCPRFAEPAVSAAPAASSAAAGTCESILPRSPAPPRTAGSARIRHPRPRFGRLLARDRFIDSQSKGSAYSYVGNSPIRTVDPSGWLGDSVQLPVPPLPSPRWCCLPDEFPWYGGLVLRAARDEFREDETFG